MKILSIDDHVLIRQGLKFILQELAENVRYTAASHYAEAKQLISQSTDYDLLLLDIALPDINGFEALDKLIQLLPTTPIIILSAQEDSEIIQQAIAKGAQGYIPKSYNSEQMLESIQQVLNGETFIPHELLITEKILPLVKLTNRQQQVLNLLAEGKSNKELAQLLNISLNTVNIHVTQIFKILGVHNRTEAALFANKQ